METKKNNYDVLILGGGPAGLTAAIYSSRYGMETGLISKDIGGVANYAMKVENYPGYSGTGTELMQSFYQQAKKFKTEFLNDGVIKLEKKGKGFAVYTLSHKLIYTKTIIIALGTQRKKLNIKGEDKFLGRGVSYCVSCDGKLFEKKDVAVIGGSDSACLAALILSGLANKVYIIYKKGKVRCEAIIRKKLEKKKNVEFVYNSIPIEIKGDKNVNSINIEKLGEKKQIKLDGVFIEVGALPGSDIAKMLGVKVDKQDYIKVDDDMKTNINGIYAAGDIVSSSLKQIVVAASQGAKAAKSAHDFLKKKKDKSKV